MTHDYIKIYLAYSDILGDLEVIVIDRTINPGTAMYAFQVKDQIVVELLNQPIQEVEEYLSQFKELDEIFKDTLHIEGEPLSLAEYKVINGVEIPNDF